MGEFRKLSGSNCSINDAELDFMKVIQPEEVGLDPSLVYRSSPTGDYYLPNILRHLHITNNDSIIDIGCGKGSAMRIMLEFPFAQIAGVELSEYIAKIAIRNFEILKESRCVVYNCNATIFPNYHLFNFYYLYNPFPVQVMEEVIEKINQSVEGTSQEKIIIYNNPTCHGVIISNGWLKINEFIVEFNNKLFIYSNKG